MRMTIITLCSFIEAINADTLFVPVGVPISFVIAESHSGDVIVFEEGSHLGPITPFGRNLTLGSRMIVDGDQSWTDRTAIEAPVDFEDSSSAAIFCHGEQNITLVGLTLRGATGTYDELYGTQAGGCVYVNRSNVKFDNCRLTGGSAFYGGGLFVSGTPWQRDAHVQLCNSVLDSCQALEWGGGVYASHCTLTVRNTSFEDISCGMATAAINALTSHVELESLRVSRCTGGVGGVAVYGGWGRVVASEFIENSTPETGFCNDLYVSDFWGVVERCVFHDEHAPFPSVFIGGPYGETFFRGNILEDNSTSTVTGTLIINNRNGNLMTHNIFRNNRNILGGALFAFGDADAIVEFNTFVGNSSMDAEGGSVLRSNTRGTPRLVNNIISGNFGNCVSMNSAYPVRIDARNNWWGHESGPYHPTLNPTGQGDTLL
ncbi:hypothetical protein HUU59_13410, partial [bacterium]|nr:hypothetical protein [bacterium]